MPFHSFDQFIELVQRKGLGFSEMMAMEMKSSGTYISRSLSFKQAQVCSHPVCLRVSECHPKNIALVTYDIIHFLFQFLTVESPLTAEQKKMYNTAAHVWCELHRSLRLALDRTGMANTRIWSLFWAAHQRFFKQLWSVSILILHDLL